MSNFVQYLQVNQNFKDLTQYGGIAPLVNAKIWVGVANQDPKSEPVEVFIYDAEDNKQIIQQPFFTDSLGNFTISEDRSATVIYPQIDEDNYSIYIEFVTDGQLAIYQRANVAAGFDAMDYQYKADLKDITQQDKTDWDTNAPTALSVDQRFTALENQAIQKDELSDSIDSNNSQQAASSKAVFNLKNYFSFDNTATEYFQSNQTRLGTGDYGLIKVTLVNGGQGGQGGFYNVSDNKPVQLQGGQSGEGLIVWLISELIDPSMQITVGTGTDQTADSDASMPAKAPLGEPSRLLVKYQDNFFELSTAQSDAINLHQPFVHDWQYLPANSGEVGQITFGKNSTEPTEVLSKQGKGGGAPVLIEIDKFSEAGAGGDSGVCTSDTSQQDRATEGQLGIVIVQSLKV